MSRIVKDFKKNQTIRDLALDLTSYLPQKDYVAEIRALFEFVRDRIRYIKDIRDVETLQWPTKTLDIEQGDCDDKAMLLASLLEATGKRTRFVAIGFGPPGEFQHVFTDVKIGNRGWLSLDPTENVKVGWQPKGFTTWMIQDN